MAGNGKKAHLHADDIPLIDSFTLMASPSPLGSIAVPATARVDVRWQTTGPPVPRGSGSGGPPAEAFQGLFAPARAYGTLSFGELGFAATSDGDATSDPTYAELGVESNGVFLV